jgi:hypothetical protein
MSIEEYLDFMPDEVTVQTLESTAVNGVKTYSMSTTTYPARIEMKNHIVVDPKTNREVTARGRIFLGTTEMIGISDLLTLPADFSPRTPPIIDVNRESDENGVHHIKVEIG